MTYTPFVTYICMIIAVINFIRMQSLSGQEGSQSAAVDCGAVFRPYIENNHQYWRLITGGFVHFSIWHLLMNLSVMWSLGRSMEITFVINDGVAGYLIYAALLFGSILLGNIFAAYMGNDYTISGGLSSGLYGLMASEIALVISVHGFLAVLSDSSLMYTIFINLIMNFIPSISWQAHLGGACFGVLFTVFVLRLL